MEGFSKMRKKRVSRKGHQVPAHSPRFPRGKKEAKEGRGAEVHE